MVRAAAFQFDDEYAARALKPFSSPDAFGVAVRATHPSKVNASPTPRRPSTPYVPFRSAELSSETRSTAMTPRREWLGSSRETRATEYELLGWMPATLSVTISSAPTVSPPARPERRGPARVGCAGAREAMAERGAADKK